MIKQNKQLFHNIFVYIEFLYYEMWPLRLLFVFLDKVEAEHFRFSRNLFTVFSDELKNNFIF